MEHSEDLAADRGVPSLVWRAGQKRRFEMICRWVDLAGASVLVDGCGVGMYVKAIREYTGSVVGLDIESEYLLQAKNNVPNALFCLGAGERLPFVSESFDVVLSHEVIEHVADDRLTASEMIRVLRPGGRAVIFCPNRLYPFETHGHYWKGKYHFGNTPLINYLPNSLRNRLAPHVRAYTAGDLLSLFQGLPVRVIHHSRIYPGFDNLAYRKPTLGKWLRKITYSLEKTPFSILGISHFLVLEKV